MSRDWPKEDPYDMSFRKFRSREEAEKWAQEKFDKLKAEGKVSESLETVVMSDNITVGVKYLVYQAMVDTMEEVNKMSARTGRPVLKGELFLNYSNMMMQIIRALIQESLELEYDMALNFETVNHKLRGYKDKIGLK